MEKLHLQDFAAFNTKFQEVVEPREEDKHDFQHPSPHLKVPGQKLEHFTRFQALNPDTQDFQDLPAVRLEEHTSFQHVPGLQHPDHYIPGPKDEYLSNKVMERDFQHSRFQAPGIHKAEFSCFQSLEAFQDPDEEERRSQEEEEERKQWREEEEKRKNWREERKEEERQQIYFQGQEEEEERRKDWREKERRLAQPLYNNNNNNNNNKRRNKSSGKDKLHQTSIIDFARPDKRKRFIRLHKAPRSHPLTAHV
ncbi:capping protein inhibiting regulator of actin dynamics-like [Portunus trituberculatus]|uniref:capping protein inhibiting regulator of actin dynamics-like n=1 Tax=Portunus trituberculatus TaxID=210409 RepID=UPI001E1D0797|nr:capping protein inhibiting regulator of actin dynamics-like [Portunus trituberculatus]